MKEVIIYDAIMGSGKTYDAIERMKKHKGNFIYVTPFLDEVIRIIENVPNVKEPNVSYDYNELKQDPVGIYEEYTAVAPGFNRDKNTITIYGKDTENGENIVYDMNKRTQRNKFYLDLLKITERGEGDSLNKQAFRKDFENAMRLSTKKRLDPLNPNK